MILYSSKGVSIGVGMRGPVYIFTIMGHLGAWDVESPDVISMLIDDLPDTFLDNID